MIPQIETVYLWYKVPKDINGTPVIFYGDNADEPIIVMTYSDEHELSWWERILYLGRVRYRYTLTITDE